MFSDKKFSEAEQLQVYEQSHKLFVELVEKRKIGNIVSMGPGEKIRAGKPTGQIAIVVGVRWKLPKWLLWLIRTEALPTSFGPFLIDVQPVRKVKTLRDLIERMRPWLPGYSAGNPKITAGTPNIAWIFTVDKTPEVLVGTNWHVGLYKDGKIGDPFIQPGAYDKGVDPTDRVGLAACCLENPAEMPSVYTDFCLIRPSEKFKPEVPIFDPDGKPLGEAMPEGMYDAPMGEDITWTGRTGATISGGVSLKHQDMEVDAGLGRPMIVYDTDTFRPPPNPGQSGSAILQGTAGSLVQNKKMQIVGVVFAGSSLIGVMIPIRNIQRIYKGIRPATKEEVEGSSPPPPPPPEDFPVDKIDHVRVLYRRVGSTDPWAEMCGANPTPDGTKPVYRWHGPRNVSGDFECKAEVTLKDGRVFDDGPVRRFSVVDQEQPPPPPPPPPPPEEKPEGIVVKPGEGEQWKVGEDNVTEVHVRLKQTK